MITASVTVCEWCPEGVHSISAVAFQRRRSISSFSRINNGVIGSRVSRSNTQMTPHGILPTACQAALGTRCLPRSDRRDVVVIRLEMLNLLSQFSYKMSLRSFSILVARRCSFFIRMSCFMLSGEACSPLSRIGLIRRRRNISGKKICEAFSKPKHVTLSQFCYVSAVIGSFQG